MITIMAKSLNQIIQKHRDDFKELVDKIDKQNLNVF